MSTFSPPIWNAFTTQTVAPGFYVLSGSDGEHPCLVKVYEVSGVLYVGYGAWDGGAVMPLHSLLTEGLRFTHVSINPSFNLSFEP